MILHLKNNMIKIENFEVAFTLNGAMCDHLYSYMKLPENIHGYEWVTNHIFEDTLEYYGYQSAEKGDSRILLKSLSSNKRFNMFMSDFDKIVKEKKFNDNKIVGSFYFFKLDSRQGVQLIF